MMDNRIKIGDCVSIVVNGQKQQGLVHDIQNEKAIVMFGMCIVKLDELTPEHSNTLDEEPIVPMPTIKTLGAKIGKPEPLEIVTETCKWYIVKSEYYDETYTGCTHRKLQQQGKYCPDCRKPIEVQK